MKGFCDTRRSAQKIVPRFAQSMDRAWPAQYVAAFRKKGRQVATQYGAHTFTITGEHRFIVASSRVRGAFGRGGLQVEVLGGEALPLLEGPGCRRSTRIDSGEHVHAAENADLEFALRHTRIVTDGAKSVLLPYLSLMY